MGNDRKNGERSSVDIHGISWIFIWISISTYSKSTRIGLWLYAQFDPTVDFLVERYGWTWLQQPNDAWRKKYPIVTRRRFMNSEKELRSWRKSKWNCLTVWVLVFPEMLVPLIAHVLSIVLLV